MKPSGKYTFTLGANASLPVQLAGRYFKVLAATGAINVKGDFGQLAGLISSQGFSGVEFTRLELTDASGSSNTITIYVGDAEFLDSGLQITANRAVVCPTTNQVSWTPATVAANVLAANSGRQYLLIQNRDPAATIYVTFGTDPAAVGFGLKIAPGGAYESGAVVLAGTVNMCSDIAGSANSVFVISA